MADPENLGTPRRSERLKKAREAHAVSSAVAEKKATPKASSSKKKAPKVRRKVSSLNVEQPPNKELHQADFNGESRTKATRRAPSSRNQELEARRKASTSETEQPPSKKPKTIPARGKGIKPTQFLKAETKHATNPEDKTVRPPAGPEASTLRKRRRKPGPEVIQGRILKIYNAIDQIPNDYPWYSDPKNFTTLPYPSLFMPRDAGFHLQRKDDTNVFPYFGRTHFADIFEHHRAFSRKEHSTRALALYGALGNGKTLCMTALACLLHRMGQHVVFVPSCHELLFDFVAVLKEALYFAIPFDLHTAIAAARKPEDIIALVNDFAEDYFVFILPEWDEFFPRENGLGSTFKASSLEWTTSMIENHYSVRSISSSSTNSEIIKSYGDTVDVINFVGGLNNDEIKHWWEHYSDSLPRNVSCKDKSEIEYMTGCMPYQLYGLLEFSGKQYSEIKQSFAANRIFSSFRQSVRAGIEDMLEDIERDGKPGVEVFFEHLIACIQETRVTSSEQERDDSYDHRYFYFTEGVGKCLSGETREVAMIALHTFRTTSLDDPSWLHAVKNCATLPMRKNILTRVCMSRIASRGLKSLGLKPMEFTYYDQMPSWLHATLRKKAEEIQCLFISNRIKVNDTEIDGIVVSRGTEGKMLHLIPIQIAALTETTCADELFYLQEWEVLINDVTMQLKLSASKIQTTYVFLHCGTSLKSDIEVRNVCRGSWHLEYKLLRLGLMELDSDPSAIV